MGPSFKPAKIPGTNRIWYSPEPLSTFLPVTVQLTPAALKPGREEMPKLQSVCVKFLREVCVARDLVHELVHPPVPPHRAAPRRAAPHHTALRHAVIVIRILIIYYYY